MLTQITVLPFFDSFLSERILPGFLAGAGGGVVGWVVVVPVPVPVAVPSSPLPSVPMPRSESSPFFFAGAGGGAAGDAGDGAVAVAVASTLMKRGDTQPVPSGIARPFQPAASFTLGSVSGIC